MRYTLNRFNDEQIRTCLSRYLDSHDQDKRIDQLMRWLRTQESVLNMVGLPLQCCLLAQGIRSTWDAGAPMTDLTLPSNRTALYRRFITSRLQRLQHPFTSPFTDRALTLMARMAYALLVNRKAVQLDDKPQVTSSLDLN